MKIKSKYGNKNNLFVVIKKSQGLNLKTFNISGTKLQNN